MYEWFASRVPGWSYENWTSGLRSRDGLPEFWENEANYADITYVDETGEMRSALQRAGVDVTPQPLPGATYHIEVKTTPRGLTTPFYVSPNQVQMVSISPGPETNTVAKKTADAVL